MLPANGSMQMGLPSLLSPSTHPECSKEFLIAFKTCTWCSPWDLSCLGHFQLFTELAGALVAPRWPSSDT